MVPEKRNVFEAEAYFRKAIETITVHEIRIPSDGEPFYNLGLALHDSWKGMKRPTMHFINRYGMQPGWTTAIFRSPGWRPEKDRWHKALEAIERSLIRNGHDHKARH